MTQHLRIGICADVHHDLIPDGMERIKLFIDAMKMEKPDFIIHLGDFCRPYEYNKPFMDLWNSFKGPKYHVFGNHDIDGGFSDDDVIRFWNAKGRYYSFDHKGFHFIVLFGNEKRDQNMDDHGHSIDEVRGYPRSISSEQKKWLEDDIEKTELPVILCNHHGLDTDLDVENGSLKDCILIRRILERANEKAGRQKVWLSISGHWHRDFYNYYNKIHYLQINSMSYQWLGQNYGLERMESSVYEKYPWFKFVAPYNDPLWAVIELDPAGLITVRGKKSDWIGPSPRDMGAGEEFYPSVPWISDRVLTVEKP